MRVEGVKREGAADPKEQGSGQMVMMDNFLITAEIIACFDQQPTKLK